MKGKLKASLSLIFGHKTFSLKIQKIFFFFLIQLKIFFEKSKKNFFSISKRVEEKKIFAQKCFISTQVDLQR